MAAGTICSDFGAPQNSLWLFPLFPHHPKEQALFKALYEDMEQQTGSK